MQRTHTPQLDDFLPLIRAEYLRGVTSERIAVLDAARILSDGKIVVHDEVEA